MSTAQKPRFTYHIKIRGYGERLAVIIALDDVQTYLHRVYNAPQDAIIFCMLIKSYNWGETNLVESYSLGCNNHQYVEYTNSNNETSLLSMITFTPPLYSSINGAFQAIQRHINFPITQELQDVIDRLECYEAL